MKNKTILEMKARELQTYIDHGYDQELANIADWEAKALLSARDKRNEAGRKVDLAAVESLSSLRSEYPNGESDVQYMNKKVILEESTKSQKSRIDDEFIDTKIKIREEAYNKRGEAERKLREAKAELDQISIQLAYNSANSKKNPLM